VAQGVDLRYSLMYEMFLFCGLLQPGATAACIGRGCDTRNGLQENLLEFPGVRQQALREF
jgi:hypothetical protein